MNCNNGEIMYDIYYTIFIKFMNNEHVLFIMSVIDVNVYHFKHIIDNINIHPKVEIKSLCNPN